MPVTASQPATSIPLGAIFKRKGDMQDNTDIERLRPRLFGLAYRMLGSRLEAEDVVQEAFLRWHQAGPEEIRSVEAWLVTVLSRLCLDRLRAMQTERQRYVGPWLPEPLLSVERSPAHTSELASDLSMALLVVLQRLSAEERVGFLMPRCFRLRLFRSRNRTRQERGGLPPTRTSRASACKAGQAAVRGFERRTQSTRGAICAGRARARR